MVAVLLISALFVSCKQEIATPQDRFGTVSIALPSSRALTPTSQSTIPTVDHWYYVATKTDSGYYKTGETEWASLAAMQAGQPVGTTFSAGEWSFSFYGFKGEAAATQKANAIYYAENIPLTVVAKDDPNYIDVVLQGGSAIPAANVTFKNLTFGNVSLPDSNYTIRINGVECTFDSTTRSYTFENVEEGLHEYVVAVYSGSQKIGEAPKVSISVSRGYNYFISGAIEDLDSVGIVMIRDVGYDKGVSASVPAVAGEATDFVVENVAPVAGKDTSVSFAANDLVAGSTYVLETAVKGIEDSSFVVTGDNVPVASIDLTLYKDGAQTTVSGKSATVSTYIAKGLSSVSVSYGAEVIPFEYDSDSGLLTFTTTHFSEFSVASTSAAYIPATNTAYASLSAALEAVTDGQVIKLLKDDATIYQVISKNIIIDMGGYTMTGSFDVNGGKVTLKNGTYRESEASYIYGKGTETVSYSALTIEKDATVIAADDSYGFVLWPTGANGYGVELNVYGNISAPAGGVGIFVSGNCTAGNSVINVYGEIEGDALGIALNGFATLNVFDGAKITGNLETAIEVRAGNLNISGGTFTSNSTTNPAVSHSNGSGTTTEGAALAIAQHTTQLPIRVNITGGSFTGNVGLFQSCPETNKNPDMEINLINGTFVSKLGNEGEAIYIYNGLKATISQAVKDAAIGEIVLEIDSLEGTGDNPSNIPGPNPPIPMD